MTTTMDDLAIHGGTPVRRLPFPPRPPYGLAERNVANEVVASGQLSGFLASPGEAFLGGPRVQKLEAVWCERFGTKHAVAMNSATSCLFAAVKAVGVGPGDEVIVTPWSMSASATCVLAAGATPVFADIDPTTYGLSANAVERAITARTKAIVTVDLFGCPSDYVEIRRVVDPRGITIIEDAAQAIGARAYGFDVGTLGEVGVFSLNRHKTLQCGEGGVAVTDSADVAHSLRRYRNHGEVLGGSEVGGNYRLGEIEAAIATVQLGRLQELTEPRIRNAQRLTDALGRLEGVTPPIAPQGISHVYYLYAVRVAERLPGMFGIALRAEGIPVARYVKPLYRLPIFHGEDRHRLQAMRENCPEAERAYREVLTLPHVHAGMTDQDIDDVIAAFQKVHAQGDLWQ